MTIQEAEEIIDIVSAALQEKCFPRFHPISALKGYDVYQIDSALKLRIANEFLILREEDNFEDQFSNGIAIYGGIPLYILTEFVADKDIERLKAVDPDSREFRQIVVEIVPMPLVDSDEIVFKDSRFESLESAESFGAFCLGIGSDDPLYWQKVYTRIGLEYTSSSPKGNKPVFISKR